MLSCGKTMNKLWLNIHREELHSALVTEEKGLFYDIRSQMLAGHDMCRSFSQFGVVKD